MGAAEISRVIRVYRDTDKLVCSVLIPEIKVSVLNVIYVHNGPFYISSLITVVLHLSKVYYFIF